VLPNPNFIYTLNSNGTRAPRLFSLPSEIRNIVLHCVLHLGRSMYVMVELQKDHLRKNERKPQSALTLLTTCKYNHHEAETIFYLVSCNFINGDAVIDFHATPTPNRLNTITELAISNQRSQRTDFSFFNNLHLFPRLRKLHVQLSTQNRELLAV
jgi:hypothetical protein